MIFYKNIFVSTILSVILLLGIVAYVLYNSKDKQIYPPVLSSCPDYYNLNDKGEVWMNWDNKGLYNGQPNYGWDVDHITPLILANSIEEVEKLNHYTNLQPLCSKMNRDIKKTNIS